MAIHDPITGPRAGATQLSPLAQTCLKHCPDPDLLEQIGRIFLDAAAELRAQAKH